VFVTISMSFYPVFKEQVLYGYLVTTSPQSSIPPSAAGSIKVTPPTSGVTNSRGVTGGVYKARERIHRGMLIRDY